MHCAGEQRCETRAVDEGTIPHDVSRWRASRCLKWVRLGRPATPVTCLFYPQYLPCCHSAAIGGFVQEADSYTAAIAPLFDHLIGAGESTSAIRRPSVRVPSRPPLGAVRKRLEDAPDHLRNRDASDHRSPDRGRSSSSWFLSAPEAAVARKTGGAAATSPAIDLKGSGRDRFAVRSIH